MYVYVASLRTATGSERIFPKRDKEQDIFKYARRCLNDAEGTVGTAISAATKNKESSAPLFLTLPEFFWNIGWSDVRDAKELAQLTDFYMDHLPVSLNSLMSRVSVKEHGKLILLAGTVAVLVETKQKGIYEALNYCLIIDNFRQKSDNSFSMSMLPKRNVSLLDFGKNIGDAGDIYVFRLSDSLNVAILKKSSTLSEHNLAEGYGERINNKLLDSCPFSIEICLDYSRSSRAEQQNNLLATDSKIDFLLACGMTLDRKYQYPDSVQYAVRNDGVNHGETQFFDVRTNCIFQELSPVRLGDGLSMVKLGVQ